MRCTVLTLAILAMATCSVAVRAAERVALVIANADYAVGRLDNVASDAQRIREALTALHFDVIPVNNADKSALLDAVDDFTRRLSGDSDAVGFVYYAGHGLQVNGVNYLVPLRADIRGEHDVEAEAFDVRRLLWRLADANNRANVVVLDACRNNPFRSFFRAPLIGLAGIGAPRNTLIAFSTGPNELAPDNGLYAGMLADELVRPGLELDRVFRNVANHVDAQTAQSQRPWLQLSVFPDVQLLPTSDPVDIEDGLGLTRTDWRRIQEALGALDFSAGTADGIPGARTRAAMAQWQAANDSDATGYLTTLQHRALLAEAELRLAELEASRRETVLGSATEPAVGVHQGAIRWELGEVFKECDVCPEMVVVPAGSFVMGSPPDEDGRDDDEGPQQRVNIAEPFAMARTEVTVGKFRQFAEATGHDAAGCYVWSDSGWEYDAAKSWRDPGFEQADEHPVACVSWDDVDAYIGWLRDETGEAYRLPSEAEWEFAARADTDTRYAFGDEISASQASFGRNKTTAVGTYPANSWGLFDMHGNVWEWVEDCWHDSYEGAPTDGSAWLEANGGNCALRVLRGGSWDHLSGNLRSAYRNWGLSGNRFTYYGFRVARTLTP